MRVFAPTYSLFLSTFHCKLLDLSKILYFVGMSDASEELVWFVTGTARLLSSVRLYTPVSC